MRNQKSLRSVEKLTPEDPWRCSHDPVGRPLQTRRLERWLQDVSTRGFNRAAFISTVLIVMLFGAVATYGEEVPTITVSKGEKISLTVSPIGGSEGEAVTKTLQNDLVLSGYFTLTGNGTYTARGSANGGSLQGEVIDRSGGAILTKSYNGSPRENAHRFADDIIETITGNKGFATSRIAFIAKRTGRKEVYVADYDGSNTRQMTHDGVISVHPSISPDGRRIAYTGYQSGYPDVYVIDLTTGARNKIVNFPGTNSGATFSPDGRRLALTVSKDGNPELYTVNANGGGARRLTRTHGIESSPSWSPNGDEIVYSFDSGHGPQLYRISSDGGSGQPIPTGYGYCTEPNWSPDGKKIAFNIRSGGTFQIAIVNANGGGTHVVCAGENPAWGADSRHIIFTDGSAIYLLDTITGHRTKIIDGLGGISEPSWSR